MTTVLWQVAKDNSRRTDVDETGVERRSRRQSSLKSWPSLAGYWCGSSRNTPDRQTDRHTEKNTFKCR